MYDGKRVVVVTPAGRKRFLSLLAPYVLRERGVVDQWRLWSNTLVDSDREFLRDLAQAHADFITLDEDPAPLPAKPELLTRRIHHFFRRCVDPNTVYVRLDDDICWIEPDGIARLVAARLAHPAPFLIMGNIVNNVICTHLHQRQLAVPLDLGLVGYKCTDDLGWSKPDVAVRAHRALLQALDGTAVPSEVRDRTADFRFRQWSLCCAERFSINVISWLGSTFAAFGGEVGPDEEQWLTEHKPKQPGVGKNLVHGDALFAHYAFFTQLAGVDQAPDIYLGYKTLAESLSHASDPAGDGAGDCPVQ